MIPLPASEASISHSFKKCKCSIRVIRIQEILFAINLLVSNDGRVVVGTATCRVQQS